MIDLFWNFGPEIEQISLDHDLGKGEKTGYDFMCWLENQVFHKSTVRIPVISFHTANPVGRENMARILESIYRIRDTYIKERIRARVAIRLADALKEGNTTSKKLAKKIETWSNSAFKNECIIDEAFQRALTEIDFLRVELAKKKEDINTSERACDAIEEKFRRALEDRDTLHQTLDTLRADTDAMTLNIDRLLSERDTLQEKVRRLRKQIVSIARNVGKHESNLAVVTAYQLRGALEADDKFKG